MTITVIVSELSKERRKEARKEGKEEGREKGRKDGRKEGREGIRKEEGERKVLGPLPEKMSFEKIPEEILENWGTHPVIQTSQF